MSKTEKKLINEDYLKQVIEELIDEKELTVKKEDAEEIVKNILPHLDRLVSNRVKEHFLQLSEFIQKTFKGE